MRGSSKLVSCALVWLVALGGAGSPGCGSDNNGGETADTQTPDAADASTSADTDADARPDLPGPTAEECLSALGDTSECNTCACDSCTGEAVTCAGDPGCLAIVECMRATHCSGVSCYNEIACLEVIDQYGGPALESTDLALALNSCSNRSNCRCGATQDWSCLGSVTPGTPSAATATVTLFVFDSPAWIPFAGASVDFCARDDTECATPLASATSGADGLASATIELGDTGYDGFARVTAEGHMPSLVFFANAPYLETSNSPRPAFIASSIVSNVFDALSGGLDAERGHVVSLVYDCADAFAQGIAVSLDSADEGTSQYYTEEANFSADPETTRDGVSWFINVPVGTTAVEATVRRTGDVVGRVDLFVRAGTFSLVSVSPMPEPGD